MDRCKEVKHGLDMRAPSTIQSESLRMSGAGGILELRT